MKIFKTTRYTPDNRIKYIRYSARTSQFHAARSAWCFADAYITLHEAEIPDDAWTEIYGRGDEPA